MNPPVYPVGCAGRITSFTETDDGRYLITLTGVSRFRIAEELPLLSGYRRVRPDWQPFARDLDSQTGGEFDRDRLIRGLKAFFDQRQISADWEAIEKAAGEHLINSIAMLCPFAPSEKQALLEAPDLDERARLLIALVEMAAVDPAELRRTRTARPGTERSPDHCRSIRRTTWTNPPTSTRSCWKSWSVPLTKGPLRYDRAAQELISEEAGLAYPIRDGIPIMLVDEARTLREDENGAKRLPPPSPSAR